MRLKRLLICKFPLYPSNVGLFSSSVAPIRIAVVGSGPAGFYCLQTLLKRWPATAAGRSCTVDLFEKLPVPYGLVRFGVAPDHPEVKNCIHQFEKTVEEFEPLGRFRFYGNVNIGSDIRLRELAEAYDGVLLAYGSEIEKKLKIPDDNAQNCLSAREFVGWYNGMPTESANRKLNLTNLHNDTAVVLGHGNVALDVARMLLAPISLLAETDVDSRALDQLKRSKIRRVILIGRRGPLQTSFTIAELREMIRLQDCGHFINKADFDEITKSNLLEKLERPRKRLTQLMIDNSKDLNKNVAFDGKHWHLTFLRTPRKVLAENDIVTGIELAKNCLHVKNGDHVSAKATLIEPLETEIIPCSLILYSIGYQSINIDRESLPFDEQRQVVATEAHGANFNKQQSAPLLPCKVIGLDNVYACGWCATGPRGVIATTQTQSRQAAERIIADLSASNNNNNQKLKVGSESIEKLLRERGVQWVDWAGWIAVDKWETDAGKKVGKSREKITDVKRMLEIAASSKN